jgi:hypothetical protein
VGPWTGPGTIGVSTVADMQLLNSAYARSNE